MKFDGSEYPKSNEICSMLRSEFLSACFAYSIFADDISLLEVVPKADKRRANVLEFICNCRAASSEFMPPIATCCRNMLRKLVKKSALSRLIDLLIDCSVGTCACIEVLSQSEGN